MSSSDLFGKKAPGSGYVPPPKMTKPLNVGTAAAIGAAIGATGGAAHGSKARVDNDDRTQPAKSMAGGAMGGAAAGAGAALVWNKAARKGNYSKAVDHVRSPEVRAAADRLRQSAAGDGTASYDDLRTVKDATQTLRDAGKAKKDSSDCTIC